MVSTTSTSALHVKTDRWAHVSSLFKMSVVGSTLAGFTLLSGLMVVVSYVSWNMGNQLNTSFQDLVKRGMVNVEVGNYLLESFSGVTATANSFAATTDRNALDARLREYEDAKYVYESDLVRASSMRHDNPETQEGNLAVALAWSQKAVANADSLVNAHATYLLTNEKIDNTVTQLSSLFQRLYPDIAVDHPQLATRLAMLVTDIQYLQSLALDAHDAQVKARIQSGLTSINRLSNGLSSAQLAMLNELTALVQESDIVGQIAQRNAVRLVAQQSKSDMEHQTGIGLTVYKLLLSQGYKSVLDGTFTAESTYNANITRLLVLFVITLAIAIVVSIAIPKAIRNPLKRVSGVLKRLSKGDLSQKANYRSHTEFGALSADLDNTIDNLRNIVNHISDTTDNINYAAEQNSQSAKDVSNSVQVQSRETNNVATALVELEASFNSVAQSTQDTTSIINEAKNLVQDGVNTIQDNNNIIQNLATKLTESSRLTANVASISDEIGGILDVISGVSDQTNLLALNAAIEAARAGENGRGFAVVADEVRGLAQKTRESTTVIGEMISRLQQAVEQSVQNIEECVKNMETGQQKNAEISASITRINTTIEDVFDKSQLISTASEQQKLTADEVSRNINEISQTTTETNSTAENLSDLSEQLKQLAHQQKEVVGQFQV